MQGSFINSTHSDLTTTIFYICTNEIGLSEVGIQIHMYIHKTIQYLIHKDFNKGH